MTLAALYSVDKWHGKSLVRVWWTLHIHQLKKKHMENRMREDEHEHRSDKSKSSWWLLFSQHLGNGMIAQYHFLDFTVCFAVFVWQIKFLVILIFVNRFHHGDINFFNIYNNIDNFMAINGMCKYGQQFWRMVSTIRLRASFNLSPISTFCMGFEVIEMTDWLNR